MNKISIISAIGSILLIIIVFELTRKRKIREQYALIWLTLGFLILVFPFFKKTLDVAANWVGIHYAPSLLFVFIVFFGIVLGIQFTVIISKLEEKSKKLIQEIGLLKNRVENLEKKL